MGKVETLNDAHIYGKPNVKLLNHKIKIGISNDGAATRPNAWKHIDGTVADLVNFLSIHKEGSKDGTCILMGEAVGVRSVSAMKDLCIIMMDHDSGEDFDDICDSAKESGYFTMLWTTHSHGKDFTHIPRDHLVKWAGVTKDDINLEIVHSYLKKVKGYADNIIDMSYIDGEERTQNGIEIVVRHNPMDKSRSLRVLKKPFDYADFNTKQEGQKEWARKLLGLSVELGVTYDESCKDPSRLMYTPRHPHNPAGEPRIVVFNGDFVDLDEIESLEPVKKDTRYQSGGIDDIFKAAGDDIKGSFKTPGLLKFVARYGEVFNIADWLEDVAPNDKVEDVFKGGLHFICPNEEAHTNIDPSDKAFRVVNAGEDTPGFIAGCLHATCMDMSNSDRVWYLDGLCQKYEVKRASDLKQWCDELVEDYEQEETKSDLQTIVDSLSGSSTGEDVRDAIELIATVADDLESASLLDRVRKHTGRPLASLKKELREADRRFKELNGDEDNKRGPKGDIDDCVGPVLASWDFDIQTHVSINAIQKRNKKEPRLFRLKGSGVPVRVTTHDNNTSTQELEHRQLLSELNNAARFVRMTEDGPQGVPPDSKIVECILGEENFDLPTLDRIINVPIFSEDGKLRTKEGYDRHTQCYLKFVDGFTPLKVSRRPSDDEVDKALEIILENAIHSFPFSDEFGGNEKTDPHKGNETPNWDRGRSSRMNTLSMILQPFCRNMIKGATPAYHIDKSAPGTGAGYLVDIPYMIMTGRRAEGKPLSEKNDEVRKVITASLRGGKPILFFDNVNHKIDSGEFAAAVTGGTWNDRILGKTEEVSIEITAQWILAGNNMSLSEELTRRMVPIRMDTNDDSPEDRDESWFKHSPLQDWLLENRQELVWACHTLVGNWVAKGRKPGKARFNSFDNWSRTMSGVMEACGIHGFMDNRKTYVEAINDDADETLGVIEYIWDYYKDKEFTAAELHEIAFDEGSGWDFEVPFDNNNPATRKRLFSNFVRKSLTGRTYTVSRSVKDKEQMKVKMAMSKKGDGGLMHFHLMVI